MPKDYSFLPDLITEDIYHIQSSSQPFSGEKIVATPEQEEVKIDSKNEDRKIDHLGQNLKEILVLVKADDQEFLNHSDEEFLKKVLLAVNIDLNDIALVNIASLKQERLDDIRTFPHGLRLCFMETIPEALADPRLKLYQNIHDDGKKILWCNQLSAIASDKGLKIKLWQQLKLIFNK